MTGWLAFTRDLADQWPLILNGFSNTLILAATISVTGLLLGCLVFAASLSSLSWVRWCIRNYISFFIGMPLIVLLFLIYFGAPQCGIHLAPFTVAAFGFTLNVAAYNAAYMTTAYRGFSMIELEAARAQGFGSWQIFRYVIFPQVIRLSIPSLTNQVIANIKDSSVAFLIQFTEFFARVQELASTNFQFFWAYLFAAVAYLGLVSLVVIIARQLESRTRIPGLIA